MKKRILVLFMVIILVLQIVACAGKSNKTETTQKELVEKVGILKNAKALDEEGMLWEITIDDIKSSVDVQGIQMFQGDLLIETLDELILVSLETGETLCKSSLKRDTLSRIQVCGDKIAISDSLETREFQILDSKLQVVKEYTLEREYSGVFLNADTTKAFCFDANGSLVLRDLATGAQEVLVEELGMEGVDDEGILIDHQNNKTYMLDMENNTVKEALSITQGRLENWYGDKWMANDWVDYNTYYFGNEKQYYSYQVEELYGDEPMLVDGPASLYVRSEGEKNGQIVGLYELDGTLISKYSFDPSDWVHAPVWSEEAGGYFMVKSKTALFTGGTTVLFWVPQFSTEGENLQVTLEYSYDVETAEQGMQLCHDKVAEISQKYGVAIKIGDECETDYGKYQAVQELRPEKIHVALDTLDKTLAEYPNGFIPQLTYGDQKVIELSFVGPLTTLEKGEYDAAAFVSEREGKNILVADITVPILEQTIYHEVMHLIDYRFEYDTEMGLSAVYNEDAWKALNPKEFEYFDSYKMPTEQWEIDYMHSYFDWFIDGYGMTYTLEDRARIMENAAIGNDDVFEDYPYLVDKLEYLCQYIRQGFDTTGWPEKTVWEKTLERCKE